MILRVDPKHRALLTQIQSALEQGLAVDAATCHHIDSTLGNPSREEIAKLLRGKTDSEGESLRELLFYPDEAFQMRLERHLGGASFDNEDETRILSLLLASQPDVTLIFDKAWQSLKIKLPDSAMEVFLARLRITWQMDPRLMTIIQRRHKDRSADRVKVRLRNTGYEFSPWHVNLLVDLFEKLPVTHRDYMACLDLVLELLPEISPTSDVYNLLIRRKKIYFKAFQEALRLKERLARDNIETLILKGSRLATIDPQLARFNMRIIDAVCHCLYGHSEYFGAAQAEMTSAFFPTT
jgi:hypothetical protein